MSDKYCCKIIINKQIFDFNPEFCQFKGQPWREAVDGKLLALYTREVRSCLVDKKN